MGVHLGQEVISALGSPGASSHAKGLAEFWGQQSCAVPQISAQEVEGLIQKEGGKWQQMGSESKAVGAVF